MSQDVTSLRLARLRPVGQPLRVRGASAAPSSPHGFHMQLTQSGTAALALAMLVARLRRNVHGAPEVLLPGYACPDLLAAAHWAGVRPILVDLRAGDTRLDSADLLHRRSARTVAVVAVNFLGIADDLPALRSVAHEANALLIEDDAQYCPEPFATSTLMGDCVVLSFGRGKPVPLVGGGALLVRTDSAAGPNAAAGPIAPDGLRHLLPALALDAAPAWATLAKLRAYNLLLHPWLYGLIARLPIGLGRTCYKPLHEVRELDLCRRGQLAGNIEWQYARARSVEQQIRTNVIPALPAGSVDLAAQSGVRAQRLLRYPILLPDRAQRDVLLDRMTQEGLGATVMYGKVLPDIDGVDAATDSPPLTNARQFADRLLTLPVHAGVSTRHIDRMATLARST